MWSEGKLSASIIKELSGKQEKNVVNGNQNSINIARHINSIELSSITIHGDAIKRNPLLFSLSTMYDSSILMRKSIKQKYYESKLSTLTWCWVLKVNESKKKHFHSELPPHSHKKICSLFIGSRISMWIWEGGRWWWWWRIYLWYLRHDMYIQVVVSLH